MLKHAAKAELRESENILFGPQVFSTLDSLLLDIHAMLQPRPIDYEQRRLLIEEFNTMAVDRFGTLVVLYFSCFSLFLVQVISGYILHFLINQ